MSACSLVAALLLQIAIALVVSVITFWGVGGFIHWWFYIRQRDRAAEWLLFGVNETLPAQGSGSFPTHVDERH